MSRGAKVRTSTEKVSETKPDFVSVARELECDESEERFNSVLRQVAKHKPKLDEAQAKKDKPGQ